MAQYALPLTEPEVLPQALEAPTTRRRLWFCIYLPQLPLEASGPGNEARAVVEEQQGVHRVLLASAKAESAGIMPGQSANAALALLPALRVEPRNKIVEQQTLEHLSSWLEQFTSVVCFAGPDVLLVEIAGSLRLYGGLLSLRIGDCADATCNDMAGEGWTAYLCSRTGKRRGRVTHGAAWVSRLAECRL